MDRHLLQLMLTRGVGDVALKRILRSGAAPREVCEDPGALYQILGTGKTAQNIAAALPGNESAAVEIAEKLSRAGAVILMETDPAYPPQVKERLGDKCPPVLFARGNVSLLSTPAVGFCGSRKVSEKGIGITEQCAGQLTASGITVVSGYAGGTDMAAHTAAVRSGGATVFVLAEGILRYTEKACIRNLLNDGNHVFVSQFPPMSMWSVGNAMKRNTIIIALSRAMILVESGRTGGTYAAGEESLRTHTPLFVIDYAKPEVSAEANPYFISQGGHPIRGRKGVPCLESVFSAVMGDTRTAVV